MPHQPSDELAKALLALVPEGGEPVGNTRLRRLLSERLGREVGESEYFAAQEALVEAGMLAKGRGRGGSVQRTQAAEDPPLTLETQEIPAEAKVPKPKQSGLPLHAAKAEKPRRNRRSRPDGEKVLSYRHDEKRKNNPEVGLVNPEDDKDERETRYAWDPHIAPALEFDIGRHDIEKLIDDALASGDAATQRRALEQLKRQAAPYLAWTGKAERTSFEVDTVSLHVHERIDPATILATLKKRLKGDRIGEEAAGYQDDLFRAWFDRPLPLREAIEFYRHERGWANRLIAGDSLLVMNSLIQKESMAGRVQMIYIDPPYGIKYGSNFQPFTHKRDVKDRRDEDLTQEPEMIKAFRDTWELGIHSWLTYLRDRLLLAKDLLHESGSVFVQISDENVHLVKNLLDEIFGAENLCALLVFQKTTGAGSPSGGTTLTPITTDFLVWYAKDKGEVKYNQLYLDKQLGEAGATQYNLVEQQSGERKRVRGDELAMMEGGKAFAHDNLTSQSSGETTIFNVSYHGDNFTPGKGGWKTNTQGMKRLHVANRLFAVGNSLRYVRFLNDFPCNVITDLWTDTVISGFGDQKVYAVQTVTKVIERCLLMTTDPGDLVLDPTCGSGTTAYVAEKWGRRWITCDTSRVAVTLAKQRLMTASYDYYDLKYPHEGLKSGFIYKSVPHVTLKSIANNPDIDAIHEKMHPAIEHALAQLNDALHAAVHPSTGSGRTELKFKVTAGGRKGKTLDFSSSSFPRKRESSSPQNKKELDSGSPLRGVRNDEMGHLSRLLEWEVPFEFPEDWPDDARETFDAFHAARQAMQKKMDASIAAHADTETLYDQPQVNRDKLRISGPFTVEAVPFATVLSLEEAEQPNDADTAIARSGESARQHGWRDELLKTGIRGKHGQILKFAGLETLPGTSYLHCTGTLAERADPESQATSGGERVVVSFGPEYAALEQRQVALALNEAEKLRPSPRFIVFTAFTFDPEAAKDIDETQWPGVTLLKAQMNADLLTVDLKKKQRGSQSFWLMGQPDVEVRRRQDGRYEVEVNGFDYFDTRTGELESGGKQKIAMWLLDTDYDERSLYPRQVFFPMAGKKDGWNKLKRAIRAELDESRLDQLHGTVSLPFEAGDNLRIAVKIVDDRGIESLKIVGLE